MFKFPFVLEVKYIVTKDQVLCIILFTKFHLSLSLILFPFFLVSFFLVL